MSHKASALLVIAAAGIFTIQVLLGIVWRPNRELRVNVEDAIIEPGASGQTTRVYFTLRTNNDPTKLVARSTPIPGQVQLRTMKGNNDRPLRAGETVFDPARPLIFSENGSYGLLTMTHVKAGETIPLTFHVEPAKAITVRVLVVTDQR